MKWIIFGADYLLQDNFRRWELSNQSHTGMVARGDKDARERGKVSWRSGNKLNWDCSLYGRGKAR